ncbi:MAG: glycosyltransferase [Clostridia bacterium]|nr:glycosyltransferase [Clostridia bacterium]
MNEIISIIIPVYNTANYLEKCLNSILNQTYKNLDIILINDGSKDNSLDICMKYKILDKRISVLTQENKGVSAARNLGIDNAKGEYIIFIDSDDYIDLKMIEVLYKNIQAYDVSICNYSKVYDKKIVNHKISDKEILSQKEFVINIFCDDMYGGYLWNKLIRKQIIGNIRFNENLSIMEDLVFLIDISENIKNVIYKSDYFFYNYVIRRNSAINSKNINMTILDAYDVILNYLNIYPTLRTKCLYRYIYVAMEIFYKLYKNKKLDKKNKKRLKDIVRKNIGDVIFRCDYNIFKKLKLVLIIMFPIQILGIKERIKDEKNRDYNN